MIKADGPAKVKSVKSGATLPSLLLLAACISALPAIAADFSEKDVQGIEAQEFGIDDGKKQSLPHETPAPEPVPEDHQAQAEAERIKAIEAEEFRVKILKRSRSGRVCMFEDATANQPRPGKILLLKDGETELAAVRVLKNYPGKFAAKIVLPIGALKNGAEYRALKKLGDKIMHMIEEREKRGKDLDAAKTDEDLAGEVAPDDNELDRGIPAPTGKKSTGTSEPKAKTSPPVGEQGLMEPVKKEIPPPLFTKDGQELEPESLEIKDEDEPFSDLAVQEDLPLEPHRHAVALQYGSVKNVDKDNAPTSYSSVGLRYGFNIWRMPFLKRRTLQDLLTVEMSLFYYTISGFLRNDDSVVVVPIIGTVRYSLLLSENLSFFGYVGLIKNNVSQGDGEVSTNTIVLATTKAALGVGAMLKIGPNWAARLDFGTDMFAVGAVLKF